MKKKSMIKKINEWKSKGYNISALQNKMSKLDRNKDFKKQKEIKRRAKIKAERDAKAAKKYAEMIEKQKNQRQKKQIEALKSAKQKVEMVKRKEMNAAKAAKEAKIREAKEERMEEIKKQKRIKAEKQRVEMAKKQAKIKAERDARAAKAMRKAKIRAAKKRARRTGKHKKSGHAKHTKHVKIKTAKAFAHQKEFHKEIHKEEYVRTGVPGFDSLFDKGFGIPSGMSVLVEGGPGSGKTIFCLSTVNGLCKQGKKCLYMSFEEPEERLVEHMENFNFRARDFIKRGLLRVKRFDALDVSRSVEALLSAAKKELLIEIDPVLFPEDYKPDFVVIDSLTSIASAFSGQESRFRIYMEQLFRYLENNKITNFLIREVATPAHVGSTFKEEGEAVSFLSDGIIVLYNVIYDSGQRGAALEILKMRGVGFARKLVDFKIINGKGVVVDSNKILKKEKQKGFQLT